MALLKQALANGEAISALTENDPADSPKMVTLPGSPPKAAILSCTHCQRGDLVEQAIVARSLVVGFSGQIRSAKNPNTPSR